jgi:S1-C subfamily serine protease
MRQVFLVGLGAETMRPRIGPIGREAAQSACLLIAATILVACGSSGPATVTRTVTNTTSTPATAPASVPASVVTSVEGSHTIQAIGCNGLEGTAFQVAGGFDATALHIVTACTGSPGSIGVIGAAGFDGSVIANDPAHDLALISPIGTAALSLETASPYVGEPVTMIGYPGVEAVGPEAAQGTEMAAETATITAVNQTVTATGDGWSETLTDAIAISTGTVGGASGSPVIDASGRVIGVAESSNDQTTYLTPASDVVALQKAPGRTQQP